MYFIDSHAHVYLPEFDEDRKEIIKTSLSAGVQTILMPAIDSSTHDSMLGIEDLFKETRAMIGLHPCSVNQDFEKEIGIIDDYLNKRNFIGIGEIGLDFYWDKTFVEQQYKAFQKQIEIALLKQLPISIHSRNATRECIDVIKQYKGLKGVFHCFSGTYEEAIEVIEQGFMLGIGGVITFKNSGLDKVVARLDSLNHIILETDAPYLAPVPYRGKRNQPSYIPIIAQKLSDLFVKPVDEICEITTQNTKKLFNL